MDAATVRSYHEASKHHLDSHAPGPGYLDWATQPDPFRTFAGAPRLKLALLADGLAARYREIRRGARPPALPVGADTIATLFELSLGLSAWKSYHGATWALRCNPSSGNLHPTEGYLVAGAVPGIEAGIHHYVSRDHALELRAALGGSLGTGFWIGLTSIHWREAWKYGIRAYRYCQLDCGHAIGAIAYAAAALGWRARLVPEPGDTELGRLLGLDRDGDFEHAEREAADCLIAIDGAVPLDLARHTPPMAWAGTANLLSRGHRAWPEIDRVHHAAAKPRTPTPAAAFVPTHPAPNRSPLLDLDAARIIRQRRSAVAFDGITALDAAAFFTMLDPLLPRAGVPPWDVWPEPPRVHLVLFVHRIEGLAPGLYFLGRDEAAATRFRQTLVRDWRWAPVGQSHLPLWLLDEGDWRARSSALSCHQELASDACFAVAMLAECSDLDAAPWRYRTRHWECGLIGQVLYLEAEAAGIRATGIGCFYDDALHDVIGVPLASPAPAWQVLYHFTVGAPIEDRRLETRAPYGSIIEDQ